MTIQELRTAGEYKAALHETTAQMAALLAKLVEQYPDEDVAVECQELLAEVEFE